METQNKRKKIVYLLREVFGYRTLSDKDKKEAIQQVYALVQEKPQLLENSISTLERKIAFLKKTYTA